MNKAKQTILWWEATGALFVIFLGSALHFAFEWAAFWRPLALVAAVNESTWEHLKMAFWPGVIWAFIESMALPNRRNLWPVKGLSLLITAILIVFLFELYTAILGENYLILDIGVFCISVVLGHFASSRLLLANSIPSILLYLGWIILVLQIMAYSLLTYFPPQADLFMDPGTGLYGIPAK